MSRLAKTIFGSYFASLLLWAFLFKGRLPFHLDARLYAYPDHVFNLQCFQKGLFPLWNPFIACGVPHLADWQSACLYPPFWLFNFTGLTDVFMGVALFHAGLAFIGGYLWLRNQKMDAPAAALGALTFAGSAHLVACWANLPFIATACWVPWIFWAAEKLLKSQKDLTFGLLLTLGLSLQILAGYPFFTFYTWLFLLVWFFFQKPGLSKTLLFLGSLALAGLITCAQWFPFLDFLSYSWHEHWSEYPYFNRPQDYLTLLSPTALGIPNSTSYQGAFANANFPLYIGLVPLALLIWNGFLVFRYKDKFWTLSAFFWLAWTAGGRFLLWRWIPESFLEFLEPSKSAGLFIFCASHSVAETFDSLHWDRNKKQSLILWVVGLLWLADLLWLPFRIPQPQMDPFALENVQQKAAVLQKTLGDGRLLSLHPPVELTFPESPKEAFDRPVALFLPNSNMVWGLRSADRYLYLQVDGSQNLTFYIDHALPQGYRGGLLSAAGVRLLLMPQIPSNPHYQVLAKWDQDFLLWNTQASPDMRFVNESAFVNDRPTALTAMAATNDDWKKVVYLEKGHNGWVVQLPQPRREQKITMALGYQRPSSNKALLWQNFSSKGFVIFNETYAPGWRAWVDDQPSPILRADGLFMAVPIPGSGPHRVQWTYEPTAVRIGFFLSLLGLGLLLFGGYWQFHRQSRLESHSL